MSLVAQMVKHLSTMWETQVRSLGWEDPLEKEMAIHSRTIVWKIPWTEEAGRLQPMGSQRVRHDWATSLSFFLSFFKIPEVPEAHGFCTNHRWREDRVLWSRDIKSYPLSARCKLCYVASGQFSHLRMGLLMPASQRWRTSLHSISKNLALCPVCTDQSWVPRVIILFNSKVLLLRLWWLAVFKMKLSMIDSLPNI